MTVANGPPATAVTITVKTDDGPVSKAFAVGPDGRYEAHDLPTGPYRIEVVRTGRDPGHARARGGGNKRSPSPAAPAPFHAEGELKRGGNARDIHVPD